MAQEIKDLIAKIQAEGIQIAQEQASKIEAQAQAQAQKIIAQAQAQAQKIIAAAQEEANNTRQSMEASLKQAGRDLLISLRGQINKMLDKLVAENIRQALTTEELAKIIFALIKNSTQKSGAAVVVSLSPEDCQQLNKTFLQKLITETRSQIVLKSSDQISAGLRISFDSGKSHFDFSDSALAEYISANIKPELDRIFKIE